jgi:hypothetical protein
VPGAASESEVVPTGDLIAITEVTRDLAYRQLDSQLSSSDNYDAKAVGVLLFDGATLAAVLAVRDAFNGQWAIPALLILLAAAAAVGAIWARQYDVGPDPGTFYDGAKTSTAAQANVSLVSELRGSLMKNDIVLRRKSGFFLGSLVFTFAAGIASAILLWIK